MQRLACAIHRLAKPIARTLFGLACLVAACCLAGSAAWAHATLVGTDPADGTTVATAPSALVLEFNEPVTPVALRLVAPDGQALSLTPALDGTRLMMPAPPALGNGTYVLSWRVISADGHPVGGAITFSIGSPGARQPAMARPPADWPVRGGIWIARVLTYLGLFGGIGGIFFCRWLSGSGIGLRISRIGLALGLVALPLSVGFQGLDVSSRPLGSFFAAAVWREGLASSFGLFVALALAGLVLAWLASGRMAGQKLLALAALLCVGLALAATGHASTADPQWLTRPAVFVHTVIVAFWSGALLPLALLLRQAPSAALAPLRRFSGAIPPLLGLLAAAGIALAAVQVATPGQLLTSSYGRVLLVKLVLVAILLGIAAVNRWKLTPPVMGGAGPARRRLVRAIAVEAVLVAGILGVVALWRFTPPPRALLDAAVPPVYLQMHSDDAMVEIRLASGRVGPAPAAIHIADAKMAPIAAKAVTVYFANRDRGIEPIKRIAKRGADGDWHVDDLVLPVPGLWQVEADILVSDFKQVDLDGQVEIRP